MPSTLSIYSVGFLAFPRVLKTNTKWSDSEARREKTKRHESTVLTLVLPVPRLHGASVGAIFLSSQYQPKLNSYLSFRVFYLFIDYFSTHISRSINNIDLQWKKIDVMLKSSYRSENTPIYL